MDRLIEKIEGLYPIDCEYHDTNVIGKVLIANAIERVGWRKLPSEFLAQYLIECANEEETGEITHQLKEKGII